LWRSEKEKGGCYGWGIAFITLLLAKKIISPTIFEIAARPEYGQVRRARFDPGKKWENGKFEIKDGTSDACVWSWPSPAGWTARDRRAIADQAPDIPITNSQWPFFER
jgi:hypothetical protein